MHSFLVSALPEIKPGPDVLEIIPETSIGIDDVRRIQNFLSQKPLQSENNTVFIHSAEKLTLPAQHALLKTLEEPPGNSKIYLITEFPDLLLPTILSRVQLSGVPTQRQVDAPALKKSSDLLSNLISAKRIGERLKFFDEAAFTRESALEFLDHLEHILHDQIQNSQLSTIDYQLLVNTRKYLKANVNVRLALDNFALNLAGEIK